MPAEINFAVVPAEISVEIEAVPVEISVEIAVETAVVPVAETKGAEER